MERKKFKLFVEKLKSFGFKVYLNKLSSPYNYAVFTDGKNIGYMEKAHFNQEGVKFSTVHKPSRNYGTGFACREKDSPVVLSELTPEIARQTFATIPPYFTNWVQEPIRKYEDFEDWKRNALTADQYNLEHEA